MRTTKKAKILRSFPKQFKFSFDNKGEYLLVQDRKTLYLIDLKMNAQTELFSSDTLCINAFGFFPDEGQVYSCVTRSDNSSTIHKINLKTKTQNGKLIVPIETCESLHFSDNNLVVWGKRYDTHIESCDGHELIDDYLCRFTLCLATNEHYLEEDLDRQDYHASNIAAGWSIRNYSLPEGLGVYTYQNGETEFWDDTIYYELYYKTEMLQQLDRDEVVKYVSEQECFESFAIISHEEFFLLVGYNNDLEKDPFGKGHV